MRGFPVAQKFLGEGVDTAITTYLLETSSRWASVCIVSKDVDFVPPVLALRRRGKRVFCAVEDAASVSALVRVCQSSFRINTEFLACDFALYRLLVPGGGFDRVCATLSHEPGVVFGIHRHPRRHREFMRSDSHVELWLKHSGAEHEAERVRKVVEVELDAIPEIASLRQWETRNDQLLVMDLRGSDLLYEGLDRHRNACDGSEWLNWEKPIEP